MSANPYINQYKQMGIKTAGRGQLLIMFYEAAIKNVKLAITAIESKDLVTKGKAITKAHEIINELMNTLNFEVGGQLAQDLERLYAFMIEQLIQANLENSTSGLKSVLKNLETLLSGWRVAIEKSNLEGGKDK